MLTIDRPVYEYGRDLSKVNWQTFRNELNDINFEQTLPKSFTITDLEETATDWERRVRKALDRVAPIRKKRLKEPIERWWNDEVQAAHDLLQEARAVQNKTRADIKKVRRCRTEFNRIRRFRKRKVKREFYSSSNTPKLLSKLEKSIRQQPRHQITLMRKNDGSFTTSLDESLDLILNKCFPGCSDYNITEDVEWQFAL